MAFLSPLYARIAEYHLAEEDKKNEIKQDILEQHHSLVRVSKEGTYMLKDIDSSIPEFAIDIESIVKAYSRLKV